MGKHTKFLRQNCANMTMATQQVEHHFSLSCGISRTIRALGKFQPGLPRDQFSGPWLFSL